MSSRRNSGTGPTTSTVEQISFNGTEAEDVTEFLRDVKRIALKEGPPRDQEWMFDYAESCLGGSALRWFSSLEEGRIVSWNGLRAALLERFGPLDTTKHITQPAPAASITNVASGSSGNIPSLLLKIERLETSIAQLGTNLQRQIDVCTESVTKVQTDLTSRIKLSGFVTLYASVLLVLIMTRYPHTVV